MKIIQLIILLASLAWWSVESLPADQVIMQNGDSYNGKVLSVTTNALVLQNDNLGNVSLPRSKVTHIIFGSLPVASSTNIQIRQSVTSQTNSVSDLTAAFRGIRDQTNLIQQVQSQILGSANPEAVNNFNEMLDGLSTGKINMNDLRQQAQSAADQLRSIKKELGPDDSGEADGYLAILDQFLQETASVNATTNSSGTLPKAKPDSTQVGP